MIPKISGAMVAYFLLVGCFLIERGHGKFTEVPQDRTTPYSIPPGSSGQCENLKKEVANNELTSSFLTSGMQDGQDACSDRIDNCKYPIKYLGANGDCACFACEYGKPTQHNICTKNQGDKDKLLKRKQH